MKKTLLALALIAGFAGAAHAQTSNVTLYGVADGTFIYTDPKGTGDSTQEISSGNLNGSRIGVKGSEDLGGGLKANFQIEGGINMDQGSSAQGGLTWGRQSWVGLSGGFGEFRVGRQYLAGFMLADAIDPFGTNHGDASTGSTISSSANITRTNNAVLYLLPAFSGFQAGIGYSTKAAAVGCTAATVGTPAEECAGSGNNPTAITALGLYANGPILVGVSYEQINRPNFLAGDDQKHLQVAGTYDLKVVKIHAAYVKEDDQFVGGTYGNNSSDSAAYMIGATAPLGSGLVRFSYQDRNDKSATDLDRRVIALGYTYNLSARTAFYSWVSDSTIKSGGATDDSNAFARRQLGVGLRHSF